MNKQLFELIFCESNIFGVNKTFANVGDGWHNSVAIVTYYDLDMYKE